MNQLTTIAKLPGSGAGCVSALPAEAHLGRVFPAGERAPWTDTRESVEYMGSDGKMYQHRGLMRMPIRPTMSERAPALLEGMKEGFYSLEDGGLVRIGDAPRAHTYADRFKGDERN